MILSKLKINTKSQSYKIFIGNNILNNFFKILKDSLINFNKCLIIVDKKFQKNF